MAQAVQYVVQVAANVLSKVIGAELAAAVTSFVVNAAVAWGLSYATSLITGAVSGAVTGPSDAKIPLRQAIPPRRAGYGRARISGAYLLFEEMEGVSYDTLAIHDGKIDGIEEHYLHDDLVTLNENHVVQELADGRYHAGGDPDTPGGGIIRFETALGEDTETPNPWFIAALGDIWTADHRGDGIARIDLRCRSVKSEDFSWVYPFGLPQPSVVARLQPVFDPRDPAQDVNDRSTWVWSKNPVLHLLHYLIVERGYNYARRIFPAIDTWIRAADVCDEDIAKDGGGTEKLYEQGGVFNRETPPATVIATMLASFDGWMGERGDGALQVFAGRYYAPTITIGEKHILDYTVQRFVVDEEAVNELIGKFTDPENNWSEAEAEPWRDEDDIIARGKTRSRPIDLFWVQSASQVRRLLKRQMIRAQGLRMSIRTTLYGLAALGHRYVRVQNPELEATADIVCQVERMRIDLMSMSVELDLVAIDPFIDAWDPSEEEGDGAGSGEVIEITPPPEMEDITAAPAFTGSSARVTITFADPDRDDYMFAIRWRVQDEGGEPGPWEELVTTDADSDGGTITLASRIVALDTVYDVQAAFIFATGNYSDWAPEPPSEVDTTPP